MRFGKTVTKTVLPPLQSIRSGRSGCQCVSVLDRLVKLVSAGLSYWKSCYSLSQVESFSCFRSLLSGGVCPSQGSPDEFWPIRIISLSEGQLNW